MRAGDVRPGMRILRPGPVTVLKVSAYSDLALGGEAVELTYVDKDGRRASSALLASEKLKPAPEPEPEPAPEPKHELEPKPEPKPEPEPEPEPEPGPDGWTPVGTTEVARMLGVKEQTVRMWRYREVMCDPQWTIGGRPVWRSDIIRDWAKQTGRAS